MTWWNNIFGDVGWQGRHSRDKVADWLEGVEDAEAAHQILRLFELDEAQAREIAQLRLTVRVLSEILVDNMGLDPDVLRERMEAAAREHETGHRQAKPPSQQAEATPEPPTPEGTRARCSICSAPAAVQATHFSSHGLVCDACAARGAPPAE